MTADSALYLFITGCIAIISFFLIRFWQLVDEIRKDVKELLIEKAGSKEIMKGILKDVEDLQDEAYKHSVRMNKLDLEINNLKKVS